MATRRAAKAVTTGARGSKPPRPSRMARTAPLTEEAPAEEHAAASRLRSARGEVSVQRALAVPTDRAWQAWADPKEMSVWFKPRHQQRFEEGGTYRNGDRDRGVFHRIATTSRGRMFRMSWENKRHAVGGTVTVEVLDRGPGRSTVRLTHSHIASEAEREELRAAWSRALDSLKSWVGRGEPVGERAWTALQQS